MDKAWQKKKATQEGRYSFYGVRSLCSERVRVASERELLIVHGALALLQSRLAPPTESFSTEFSTEFSTPSRASSCAILRFSTCG